MREKRVRDERGGEGEEVVAEVNSQIPWAVAEVREVGKDGSRGRGKFGDGLGCSGGGEAEGE